MEYNSKRVLITAENHGFAIAADSLSPDLIISRKNLNDGTVEGIEHRNLPLFSIQCHPEASPGPHDSFHLFDAFITMIKKYRNST